MQTTNKQKPRLIAIAVSHYCEKVRWALDYLDVDYVEENHAPPFHKKYTSGYGGSSVPVLVMDDKSLTDSQDILHYLDSVDSDKQLYPQETELRQQVETLEELFNSKLGVATRRWAYYYALQKPVFMAIAWGKGASLIEKIKCAIAAPKTFNFLKQNYNATPKGKDTALQDIREVFALVNQRLSSGQKYLVGDRPYAADLTFAALASPVLRPQNHPVYNPQLSKLPPEMVAVIEELRATPAGELVLRLYREHRH